MFSLFSNYYTTTLNELSIKTKPNSQMDIILNIIWTQPHICVLTLVLTYLTSSLDQRLANV